MSDKYDRITASHYWAYRPPLHDKILKYVISDNEFFADGLDVGCGTGYSAIALGKYCSHVYGIEPSESMLERAIENEKIVYLHGYGDSIPVGDNSIDIVTFAGSLSYAKSSALVEELKRVCRKQAFIIAYDFEVLVDDILDRCGINPEKPPSDYDHQANFSDDSNFTGIVNDKKEINFKATASEIAHILLSSSYIYDAFAEQNISLDVFSALVNELKQLEYDLKASIYFSKYQFSCD